MTYRELVLQAFPDAVFETYIDGTPSICIADLGLLEECPSDMLCVQCWNEESGKPRLDTVDSYLSYIRCLEAHDKLQCRQIEDLCKEVDRLRADKRTLYDTCIKALRGVEKDD